MIEIYEFEGCPFCRKVLCITRHPAVQLLKHLCCGSCVLADDNDINANNDDNNNNDDNDNN